MNGPISHLSTLLEGSIYEIYTLKNVVPPAEPVGFTTEDVYSIGNNKRLTKATQ